MIKPGVSIAGLRPEIVSGLAELREVCRDFKAPFVITSGTDGKHGTGSLHYVGLAVDLRRTDDPLRFGLAEQMLAAFKQALGAEFDAVLEKDHFHIEFQPK